MLALVVDERTDLAVTRADDDDVADAQRAVLDEDGRNRSASAIERRFDDDTGRAAILVRLEIANVGFEQHRIEKCLDSIARPRRDGDHLGRTAPIDGL